MHVLTHFGKRKFNRRGDENHVRDNHAHVLRRLPHDVQVVALVGGVQFRFL